MSTKALPRVLIVHNYYQLPGGEDTVVANEKKLLEANRHEVFFYSRHNNEIKEMSKLGRLFLPFLMIFNPRTFRDVRRMIKQEQIEVVHVHNTLNLISPAVYYAARSCGVPVVQTVHNFRLLCPGATFFRNGAVCEECLSKGLMHSVKYGCYRGSKLQTFICVLNTWLHRATGIYRKLTYITLTEFNKEKLLQWKQIRPEQIFVKANSVAGGAGSGQREGFIYVGRLEEVKGVKVLLKAWKLLGAEAPHLTICGNGPLEAWCRQEIKGLNVEMRGFVPNAEVKELIGQSQALILPTMLYEGFPMTIVEAYSTGTPVICSNLGNSAAVVHEGITGWKFETGNAESLAAAVGKWRDISDAVKAEYEQHYTAEVNYQRLIDIYSKIKE